MRLAGFTDTDTLPDRDRAVAAGLSAFNRVGTPGDVADVSPSSRATMRGG
jgi:3-oxoacyl-[acyl-carrier protein] reductase